jgi:hypothetical protein
VKKKKRTVEILPLLNEQNPQMLNAHGHNPQARDTERKIKSSS